MRRSSSVARFVFVGVLVVSAHSVAEEATKPLPASLVGWHAFHQAKGAWKCRKIDAKLAEKLKPLGCKWETPMATPAVVCHEKGEDQWVAFETKKACDSEVALMGAD